MSFLVKEYEISFLGEVKLIEATGYDKSFNGNYYAENNKLGIFCRQSKSIEKLMENVSFRIKSYIQKEIKNSEKRIVKEKEKKTELELILEKTSIEENTSQKNYDWLKEYQTDNPLQLEYQCQTLQNKSEGGNK